MSVLSKVLQTEMKHLSCSYFTHPNQTCKEAFLKSLYQMIVSNGKYFVPLVLIPLFLKVRRINGDVIKDSFQYHSELTLAGYMIAITTFFNVCLLRNIFGRFYTHTIITIPSFIGGFTTFFFKERVTRIFSTSLFQASLEVEIRKAQYAVTRTIKNFKVLQTLMFMAFSGIILHITRKSKQHMFWFIQPTPISNSESEDNVKNVQVCTHKMSCKNHILNGLKTYFLIGVCLEVGKALFAKAPKGMKLSYRLLIKLSTINPNSVKFLMFYIGAYRIIHCLINNTLGKDNDLGHLLSAFMAGTSYAFYPRLQVLTYAATVAIQILWSSFCTKDKQRSQFIEYFKQLPFGKLSIPLTLAFVVHNYLFNPHLVNAFTVRMIDGIGNNRASVALRAVEATLEQFNKRTSS